MIKEYKYLLAVLILALLGVIGMQSYFTYNDYQLKTVDFQRQVDTLFLEAIQIEKNERIDCILSLYKEYIQDTSKIIIQVSEGEEEGKLVYKISDAKTDEGYISFVLPDDGSIPRPYAIYEDEQIINLIVERFGSFMEEGSFIYIADIFGDNLVNITDSISVDSFRLAEISKDLMQELGFNSEFKILISQQSLSESKPNATTEQGIFSARYTTDVRVARDEYYAQIYLPNPFQDIIRKAWISVLGSMLIIGLTIGCFVVLLNSLAKQKALIQIKDDFIDNITHELQTPIATLMAANESMEKYAILDDKTKTQRYLKVSKEAIVKLSWMVDQALKNSIYQQKGIDVNLSQFDPSKIVDELLHQYRLKTDQQLEFKFQNKLEGQEINSDPTHFTQILDNLLSNAIRHNAWEGLSVKIDARQTEDGQHEFTIQDNGQGIKKTHQKKIFDKYFRVDDRSGEGYGIGLYYVKQAVEALGGNIELQSKVGEGSKFVVTLPRWGNLKNKHFSKCASKTLF